MRSEMKIKHLIRGPWYFSIFISPVVEGMSTCLTGASLKRALVGLPKVRGKVDPEASVAIARRQRAAVRRAMLRKAMIPTQLLVTNAKRENGALR